MYLSLNQSRYGRMEVVLLQEAYGQELLYIYIYLGANILHNT